MDFYLTWNAYQSFLGDVGANHWAGLDPIHALTKDGKSALYVKLKLHNGETRYSQYEHFKVDDEDNLYKLEVSGYRGTAGNPAFPLYP